MNDYLPSDVKLDGAVGTTRDIDYEISPALWRRMGYKSAAEYSRANMGLWWEDFAKANYDRAKKVAQEWIDKCWCETVKITTYSKGDVPDNIDDYATTVPEKSEE